MDLMEKISKYNQKQIDFIMAMLETGNISKSCKVANITETTAFKYLRNGLKEDINSLRKIYIEENLKLIEFSTVKATKVIIDILEDKDCPKTVKLNASKMILEYTLKMREQTEIIERIENIEKGIKENEQMCIK